MESTEGFKTVIEAYLNNTASQDPIFKTKFESDKKNIDDCITYILNTVQKSGCNGFADDEIFGMALHYYDEENIEVGKKVNGNVVVNHTGTNPHAKAYRINANELKFVNESLKKETNAEMQKNWEQDLKDIKNEPKKYWDAYVLENLEEDRLEEIKFMQDHYKAQAKTQTKKKATPKRTTKKPQQKAKADDIIIKLGKIIKIENYNGRHNK